MSTLLSDVFNRLIKGRILSSENEVSTSKIWYAYAVEWESRVRRAEIDPIGRYQQSAQSRQSYSLIMFHDPDSFDRLYQTQARPVWWHGSREKLPKFESACDIENDFPRFGSQTWWAKSRSDGNKSGLI